jgi:hypothetical protein
MTSSPKTWGGPTSNGGERRPQQTTPGALISQTLFKTFTTTSSFGGTFSSVLGLLVWKENSKEKEMKKGKERNKKKQLEKKKKKNLAEDLTSLESSSQCHCT